MSKRMPPPESHASDSDSDSGSDSDPPPPLDEVQSFNLLTLLERTRWTKYWYCTIPSDARYSTERWVFISHDGSMFEGAWYRHTYSASRLGGTKVICNVRSRLSPFHDETTIPWLGASFTTIIDGDMRGRRKLVCEWLIRNTCFLKMPRPFPCLKEWSLMFAEEGCSFTVLAMTEDMEGSGSGRIYKPLVQAQANPKGMEVRFYYDKPSSDLPRLMDREMGLLNLVILYFALMKFDTMPPPPLPLKAQMQLRHQHEMDIDDSSDDDAGPGSDSDDAGND